MGNIGLAFQVLVQIKMQIFQNTELDSNLIIALLLINDTKNTNIVIIVQGRESK